MTRDELHARAVGEPIAQAFHEAYERLAPQFSYKTREASAVPWRDVPHENKALMAAVVCELIDRGLIAAADQGDPLVRLSEVVEWVEQEARRRGPGHQRDSLDFAVMVLRRFAPDPADER